jgi:hypothetical protein
MSENNSKKTIGDSVLAQISKRGLRQKPKWKFIFQSTLLVLVTTTLVLLTLYIFSFIVLVGKEQEVVRLLGLGPRFTLEFIQVMPWLLVLLLISVFVVLQTLIRYFDFGYRRPVFYTLIGTILLTGVVSYGYFKLDPEGRVVRFGEEGGVPVLGSAHSSYRDGKKGSVARGVVTKIDGNNFSIETYRSSSTLVFIVPSQDSSSVSKFMLGDSVFVVFKKTEKGLESLVFQKIKEGQLPPPRPRPDTQGPGPRQVPLDKIRQ